MKIGIITFYYNSVNYGGVLQAFALCEVLREMGLDAEQICYEISLSRIMNRGLFPIRIARKIKSNFVGITKKIYFNNRYKKFNQFCNSIPHSPLVYSEDTISECKNDYDIFIVGSDQMWNLDSFQPAYFLDFIENKKKITYAVSLGRNSLSKKEKEIFAKLIRSFDAISVREKNAVDLISDCYKKPVVEALDPTLIVNRCVWDGVCSERQIDGAYMLCHFIGDDYGVRDKAKEYAEYLNLKIVNIPHPSHFNQSDKSFGDIQFKDAGPGDFISLVRYADVVLTDSFHCCAFSTIYEKQFFAFHRIGKKGMSGRVESLLEKLNAYDHFCDTDEKMNVTFLKSVKQIDYVKGKETLALDVEKSIEYLRRNLML